jgi:hypothetical protein
MTTETRNAYIVQEKNASCALILISVLLFIPLASSNFSNLGCFVKMMSLGDFDVNFGRSVPNEYLYIVVIPCSCTIYAFRVSPKV